MPSKIPTEEDALAFSRLPAVHETPRLRLSFLTPDDITVKYLEWFADDEVVQFLEIRDLDRQKAIHHLEAGQRGFHYRMYAIRWRDTNEHIGNIKLGPINWRDRVSDLVTVVGEKSAWGKGVAAEAILAGIGLAFGVLDLRKLSGGVYSDNVGSLKTYQKAGWQVEGRLTGHHIANAVVQDRVLISCFNPKYFPARSNVGGP